MVAGLILFLFLLIPLSILSPQEESPWKGSVVFSGEAQVWNSITSHEDLEIQHTLSTLALRVLVIQKNRLAPWNIEAPDLKISGGLYHYASDSYVLHGPLTMQGVLERCKNPWDRSLPYVEAHNPSGADLNTQASPSSEDTSYALLSYGLKDGLRFYTYASEKGGIDHAAGFGMRTGEKSLCQISLEAAFASISLPERRGAAWFSNPPPLPSRDLLLIAASTAVEGSFFSLAGDLAYSKTVLQGTGYYGNLGMEVYMRPWRFSLGLERSNQTFVGRDGKPVAQKTRMGGKVQRRLTRGGLLLLAGMVAMDKDDTRIQESSIRARGKSSTIDSPIGELAIALDATAERQKPSSLYSYDTMDGTVSFYLGKLRINFGSYYNFDRTVLPGVEEASWIPLIDGSLYVTKVRYSTEFILRFTHIGIESKMVYTESIQASRLWEASFGVKAYGKAARLGINFGLPLCGEPWSCRILWRWAF